MRQRMWRVALHSVEESGLAPALLFCIGVWYSAVWYSAVRSSGSPCGCAEERRSRRIRAKTCLSRRRVVFDPGWTEHRRLPRSEAKGTQEPGSPFGIRVTSLCEVSESPLRDLLLTFLLAKQKKSELPPGYPRPAELRREHQQSIKQGPGATRQRTTRLSANALPQVNNR